MLITNIIIKCTKLSYIDKDIKICIVIIKWHNVCKIVFGVKEHIFKSKTKQI